MVNEHSRLLSARYGATVAHLRRIFLLFGLLVAEHYTKIDIASNMVQLWRVCAVFFLFFRSFSVDASLESDEWVKNV